MKQDHTPALKEFRTILPYLKKYRRPYVLGFLCLLAVDGAQALIPQFIRAAVDTITGGNFEIKQIVLLCLGMLGVMALVASGRFLWRYFLHGSSRRIETELRDKLFSHLLTLSYDFYQKHKIGDIMARAIHDLHQIRMAIGWGLVTLVDGTIMTTAILIIIFVQDPRTAAFCIIPLPLITILMLLFGKAIGRRFYRANETYSAMSDTVQETFAGIRVVKSFVKEWWFARKFEKSNDDYRKANMEVIKIYGAFFPLVSFLAGLTTIILLLVGGRRVVLGQISAGELVALFAYLQMLIWPLMGTGFMVSMIQRGAASMRRINELLNSIPSISDPEHPKSALYSKNKDIPLIELRNLQFSYNASVQVLNGISLSVPRGSILGILGKTGSGKSTLIKTLMRMIDPPEGTIFVEGIDIKHWKLQDLRRLFGVSPQDSYLFSDSIKNNIAYGIKDTEDLIEDQNDQQNILSFSHVQLCWTALKKAATVSALENDLAAFAGGWDTLIGERGLTLSGGQKQRVAIARALLSAPEILVLDDAFSAVDAETEKSILTGIIAERHNKTTIIISHRVSTLSCADTVAVLDEGKIKELGSPKELLRLGAYFARMAELQRLGESAEARAASLSADRQERQENQHG